MLAAMAGNLGMFGKVLQAPVHLVRGTYSTLVIGFGINTDSRSELL